MLASKMSYSDVRNLFNMFSKYVYLIRCLNAHDPTKLMPLKYVLSKINKFDMHIHFSMPTSIYIKLLMHLYHIYIGLKSDNVTCTPFGVNYVSAPKTSRHIKQPFQHQY